MTKSPAVFLHGHIGDSRHGDRGIGLHGFVNQPSMGRRTGAADSERVHRPDGGDNMRTFLAVLAAAGAVAVALSFTFSIARLGLGGAAALILAIVMAALAAPRTGRD